MYHVTEEGWTKISADDSGMKLHYAYAEEGFSAPLSFRLGIAGDLVGPAGIVSQSSQNRITAAYDLSQPNDYDQQMQFGLEYAFAETCR